VPLLNLGPLFNTPEEVGFFMARKLSVLLGGSGLVLAGILISCSSSSPKPTSGLATANVVVSDPATCQAPSGPFSHVYVTITDVQASTNPNAGDNDPSFVDLTPGLSSSPKQVDLLGEANNQCFLASLGSTTQLQAGNYQQIRIILANNNTTVANNACTGAANCVVLNNGTTGTLQLSSEATTGIKIPSGQIAGGQFSIGAGQTEDLDIDFNACASIVQEGNGQYRLKPVLHAGEVSTTATSINGTVLDSVTGKAVAGQVTVALEQKDATGVDRIFMAESADSSGGFTFCPLPAGTYDLVIVAETSTNLAYAPVVITGLSPGDTAGSVVLQASAATAPATITGSITSQGSSSAIPVDAQVSFLQQLTNGPTVTIPLLPNASQPSSMLALTTAAGSTCATGTDCAAYSAELSASPAFVGAYASSGATLVQGATSSAAYTVDAIAFVPSSGGTLDCSPSELKTSTAVMPVPASSVSAATLAFTGCQ
jgi:hypothetical protein